MPTELEELVEFLHHGNTQIRQIAAENLVPYSKTSPAIFKEPQFIPIKDLKLLIKDYPVCVAVHFLSAGISLTHRPPVQPIASSALTILINLTANDTSVLASLAEDDTFLTSLLVRLPDRKNENADLGCMLLANLVKHPSLKRLGEFKAKGIDGKEAIALEVLVDLFNKGAAGWNEKKQSYEYLGYVFADLAKNPSISAVLTQHPTSNACLLSTLLPFTTHPSHLRRRSLASLLRNTLLSLSDLSLLVDNPSIFPSPFLLQILLPLMPSNASISDKESDLLLPELQLLGDEHTRETDPTILMELLEVLYLIVVKGDRDGKNDEKGVGKNAIKDAGGYLVVRELHVVEEDEGVRTACERVVDVLLKGEMEKMEERRKGREKGGNEEMGRVTELGGGEDEDEDEKVIEVF